MRGKKAKVLRAIAKKQAAQYKLPVETQGKYMKREIENKVTGFLKPVYNYRLLPCVRKSYQDMKSFYKMLKSQGKHHRAVAN